MPVYGPALGCVFGNPAGRGGPGVPGTYVRLWVEHVYRLLDRFNGEDGHETFWERVMEHSESHEAYRDGADAFGRQLRELTAGGDSDWPEILVREAI